MKKRYFLKCLLGLSCLSVVSFSLFTGCSQGSGNTLTPNGPFPPDGPTPPNGGGTPSDKYVPTTRFGVFNGCSEPVWIQQSAGGRLAADPYIVKIEPNSSYDFHVPDGGSNSFMVWPKFGCDANGEHCRIGQSINDPTGGQNPGAQNCDPTYGCQPAFNSKFEASFGGENVGNLSTFFDGSNVDGVSTPYKIKVFPAADETNPECNSVDASALDLNACPTDEDLSTPGMQNLIGFNSTNYGFGPFNSHTYVDANGIEKTVDLRSQNLRVIDPATGQTLGCFSPGKKLVSLPIWGGLGVGVRGITKDSDANFDNVPYDNRALMYELPFSDNCLKGSNCEVTPGSNATAFQNLSQFCQHAGPVSGGSTYCSESSKVANTISHLGPIVRTKYVQYIHKASGGKVYGWQYDDEAGTRVCNSRQSKIAFIVCK